MPGTRSFRRQPRPQQIVRWPWNQFEREGLSRVGRFLASIMIEIHHPPVMLGTGSTLALKQRVARLSLIGTTTRE
jgi:hypothetical protein